VPLLPVNATFCAMSANIARNGRGELDRSIACACGPWTAFTIVAEHGRQDFQPAAARNRSLVDDAFRESAICVRNEVARL
jgi:hypothetical protein